MSPLFPTIHDKKAIETRVVYSPAAPISLPGKNTIIQQSMVGKNKLSIGMERIGLADCQPVENVESAENIILSLGDTIEHEIDLAGKPVSEILAGITMQTQHYCNILFQRTKRGSGNVVIMGREVWKLVEDTYNEIGSNSLRLLPPVSVGRWEKKGLLNGGASVYVGDGILANEVFVAYVGLGSTIDGPGGLLKDNGDLFLRVMDDHEKALGNALDYVQRFRINIK